MSRMRTFGSRLLGFLFRHRRERELDEELESHLRLLTEETVRRGMNPEDAEHAARREFGGVEQTKEAYREQRGLPLLETLLQDVRFGVRLMAKNAALSTVVIAILAVGIGAGTSLYSLIDACLVRSIPYPVANRWGIVRAYLPHQKTFVNFLSIPEIREVKQLHEVFEDVGAVHGDSFTLTRGEYPERILGTRVTANAISMTQVQPILGRTFRDEEDRPGGTRVAMLRYELWQRRFAGDRNVLGTLIRLDDLDYTII